MKEDSPTTVCRKEGSSIPIYVSFLPRLVEDCNVLGIEHDDYYDDYLCVVECARCGSWFYHQEKQDPHPVTDEREEAAFNFKPRGPEIREIARRKGYSWAIEEAPGL